MARWVDVRVPHYEHQRTLDALHEAFAPVSFRLDLDPPASEPNREVEFQVEGHTELEVVGALSRRGVTVLAARERIGEPLTLIGIIEESMAAPDGGALYTTPSTAAPPLTRTAWERFVRWTVLPFRGRQ